MQSSSRKLRGVLSRLGIGALGRLLGAADSRAVATVAARELSIILRSRDWRQYLEAWCLVCAAILFVPLLYRAQVGRWRHPGGDAWFALCGYALQLALGLLMAHWSIRRLRRDLASDRLDELMLTACSPADIANGEALASAVASFWLVAASFPVCLLLAAIAGDGFLEAAKLAVTLAPAGVLGVWFGMGWGMAFTLRRPSAFSPMTEWWIKTPLVPIWVLWGAVTALPVLWAILSLIPGGVAFVFRVVAIFQWCVQRIAWHWNPILAVGAIPELWRTTWATDWLVLVGLALFMMRKSMDSVQLALTTLPERDRRDYQPEHWIHHDVHYFLDYGTAKRRIPAYRDGGNPLAAFDVALGHRVYLHPALWCIALLAYLFLIAWSFFLPWLGLYTGLGAILMPATAALLLMSGGVAVSFAWERDQGRWPALAALPITNIRLALGKIKGVVRPTLWMGLLASLTAVVLGWRGALPLTPALWMALHVLVFPVALSCLSAVLALTKKTLDEALFWWAFLGAIPTAATILPPPIGGTGGIALPFTPPLLALLMVLQGATPELIRASWISLAFELVGMGASLLVLAVYLRRWTVGERD